MVNRSNFWLLRHLDALLVFSLTYFSLYLHLDVSKEKDWQQAISAIVKRFGKLNILVNNAGITGFQEGFGP